MKRRCLKFVCAVLLLLSMSIPVSAWSQMPLVVDDANLLSDSEEQDLLRTLQDISNRHQMDVVVVTVDSLRGQSPRNFADDFYDYNGYAYDGVLLLVCMGSRDWYISTTGFGITAVTDAGLDYMAEQFLGDLSAGYYYDAFMTYAQLCDAFIEQAKAGNPYDEGNLPKEPFPFGKNLLISLVIGLVVALISTGIMKGQLKSVRLQSGAKNYVKTDSLRVTNSREMFLYRQVHKQARPKQDSSSGGSSTHRSSSGRSHGGGGGKF